MTEDNLYNRCGEHEGITTMIDGILGKIVEDRLFDTFTRGYSKDSMKRRRRLLIEFVSQAFGGPIEYTGRDMKTAHDGTGITEGHWSALVSHLDAVLDEMNLSQDVKDDVFKVLSSVKSDIV